MSADISRTSEIAGFIGACLVDSDTGLMLTSIGGGKLDLEAVAAAGTEVVRAQVTAAETLGLGDGFEDLLVTLGTQIHILRPLAGNPGVFLYVALDRAAANLGMARLQVKAVEAELDF